MGGYKFGSYFSGSASLALTFKEYVPSPGSGPNATEASQFFDLFPLGIVLAVVNAIKRKK